MRAPLLPNEAVKSSRNLCLIIPIGLLLLALFVHFNAMEKDVEMREILEQEAVSARFTNPVSPVLRGPDDWGKFLVPYWGVYSMTVSKKYGNTYFKGKRPEVSYENCVISEQGESGSEAELQYAPACEAVCFKKVKGEEVTDQYCTYAGSSPTRTSQQDCLEVSGMLCWGDTGMVVNDGTQDWTIKMHYDGSAKGEPYISWMHGQGTEFDFFYFGWGQVKTYEHTTKVVKKWTRLLAYVRQNVDVSKPLVIAGHSEGSTYAIALNHWLLLRKYFNKGDDHERFKGIQTYVIISGTMPVSPQYREDINWWYRHEEPGTVLALMAGYAKKGQNFASLDVFGKLDYPDPMFTPNPTPLNYNWPSFAFTCYNGKNGRMILNPTIHDSVATFRSQPSNRAYYHKIHNFGYYRKCANELKVTSANTENFKANTAIIEGVSRFHNLPTPVGNKERKALKAMMRPGEYKRELAKVEADGNLQSKIETWKAEGNIEN